MPSNIKISKVNWNGKVNSESDFNENFVENIEEEILNRNYSKK
jgi:hypothetical protein